MSLDDQRRMQERMENGSKTVHKKNLLEYTSKVLNPKDSDEFTDAFKTSYRTQFKPSPKNRDSRKSDLFQRVEGDPEIEKLFPSSPNSSTVDRKIIMWGGKLHQR